MPVFLHERRLASWWAILAQKPHLSATCSLSLGKRRKAGPPSQLHFCLYNLFKTQNTDKKSGKRKLFIHFFFALSYRACILYVLFFEKNKQTNKKCKCNGITDKVVSFWTYFGKFWRKRKLDSINTTDDLISLQWIYIKPSQRNILRESPKVRYHTPVI